MSRKRSRRGKNFRNKNRSRKNTGNPRNRGKRGGEPEFSSDHIRPKSRGGADKKDRYSAKGTVQYKGDPKNEIRIPHNIHKVRHKLFYNDRISEIVSALIFCWETKNPHLEAKQPHTWHSRLGFKYRKKQWNILFGKECTKVEAIKNVIKIWTKPDQEKILIKDQLRKGLCANELTQSQHDHLVAFVNSLY